MNLRAYSRSTTAKSTEENIDTLSGFYKRGVNLFAYVPQVVNVGNAHATLKAYENMTPEDLDYDEDEKETAEGIVRNWCVYAHALTS